MIRRAVDDLPAAGSATTIDGDFATVDGDDVLLRQAFSNLLRNSLEACAAGGTPAAIHVRGEVSHGDLTWCSKTTVLASSAEALSKAFQPFATTKAAGTGLGLAIVQKVIVSHNGHIAVANHERGGAQFRIRLPLARPS